jgi:hypothetical protein
MGTTRRPSTFAAVVGRVLVTRVAMFGAGAAVLAIGHLMAPISSSSVSAQEIVRAQPTWTIADSADYPGCVPASAWQAGAPARFVVVHSFRDNEHRKVAFDTAWSANHDDTESNDVWVLGVCGPRP